MGQSHWVAPTKFGKSDTFIKDKNNENKNLYFKNRFGIGHA